jgi:hypothetical protein
MYWLSVNTSGWVDGGHTEIRIGFTEEAKAEAELWSTPDEKLIERCFWRLVSERWDEIFGDSVTFEVDLPTMQRLISSLPAFEVDKLN